MIQKILVMGGSYFVGKKITEVLLENDYAVYTLNRGTKPNIDNRITNLICDRNNPEQMKSALSEYAFDAVIDVSGLNKPQAEILCNSLDTSKLAKFIFISSSAVYDVEHISTPISETANLSENKYWTFYGQNKIEAESCYTKSFENTNTELIILRPPYVYGEDNYAQRESFIFDHVCNDKPIIMPKSNYKLQFIYTTDLANIIIELLNKSLSALSIFNVGNKEALTFKEWIECCQKVVGKKVDIIEYDHISHCRNVRDFFPFFDYDNVLDVSKINEICTHETDFTQGLRNAYHWYVDNKNEIIFKEIVIRNESDILNEIGYIK